MAGRLPRHRVALVGPGERDEWYSASVSYARALALAVLPAVRRAAGVAGPVVGMGASLHAQGYRVGFVALPDVHNYVAWRDAFDAHLTGLLAEVWGG